MLLTRQATDAVDVVERLGGLQAQQSRPPFTALWTRIAAFKSDSLVRALHERKLLRATMLRGTLHLVSPRDFLAWRPVLQPMLTAGALAILRDRLQTLDHTHLLDAARECFKSRPRTFTSLRDGLMARFPDGDERAMGYFARMHLPLGSVPDIKAAWAFNSDAEFELATQQPLGEGNSESLVRRYLSAFGPASIADFQAWSGLKNAKVLFGPLEDKLSRFQDARKRVLYDLPEAPRPAEDTPAPVRFIAEFDNLILGHADRSRIISDEHRPRVVTKNLLVLGTFLVDGFVAGIWKTERKKQTATLRLEPFDKLSVKTKKALELEGEQLIRFLEPDAAEAALAFA